MLIAFLVMAVGSAFAADDVANETVSLDEQDEIIEIENDSILEEVNESVVSEEPQENLQASNTVTNDTFFNYFDGYGQLTDETSDELVFEGEFSNIPNVHRIAIDRPITLTGNNAVLKNIGILIDADNVVVNNFNISYRIY